MWLERYLGLFSYMHIEHDENLDQWGLGLLKQRPIFLFLEQFHAFYVYSIVSS